MSFTKNIQPLLPSRRVFSDGHSRQQTKVRISVGKKNSKTSKTLSGKEECKDWWGDQSASRGVWWNKFAVPPGIFTTHTFVAIFSLVLILTDGQEVTSDVLARGIFSERGLKSAIDHAVTARLGKVGSQV